MAHRIEVSSTVPDTRAAVRAKQLQSLGFAIEQVQLVDVYTLDPMMWSPQHVEAALTLFANPLTQKATVNAPAVTNGFSHAIEVGFLPGVTDNIGMTARQSIEDRFGTDVETPAVYSSQLLLFKGDLGEGDLLRLRETLANPIIQRTHSKDQTQYARDGGMGIVVPRVHLAEEPRATLVDVLNASDDQLAIIGKKGVPNPDGSYRGPLSMDLAYMKAVKEHFRGKGRNPSDVELESIAQTWSEHCKHTIFADPIDEIQEGLFKHYIRRATEEIRRHKGGKDFCLDVFRDNAGVIVFDDFMAVADKVETHNTPSALDPPGGSGTGIVGVDRDDIGCLLGTKPVAHGFGFCFAPPWLVRQLYRGENKTQPTLSPGRIMEGVIKGVEYGSNCSGIPTPQGFVYFDERYCGKPLVFVRAIGIVPRTRPDGSAYEKHARPGDFVVMVGGRVGKDGIHGATFSSEALDTGSPATAVQICDPITQKKMSDALIKEARDLGLYTSITDNGAGGLSCSVAEMAKESGGFRVLLEKIPLKYPGLQPWETWISESQERMTLSVAPEKWGEFSDLMKRRGVEATVIGEFTNSGKCVIEYKGERVMDLDMDFLHNGLPPRPMRTTYTPVQYEEPAFASPENLTLSLEEMLRRPNLASFAFISQQYDHEVQGGSVLKPLQGRGLVNADTTIVRPVLSSRRGLVLSHGINPGYSDIDTYHMAANAIDTAVRNAVAAGAPLDHLALMDNFCWCSSTEPERLGQLKRACEACYDGAVAYGTPYISGKDSMFNDFKGYDAEGNPIKVSIPPTLLISSIGVMKDVSKAISLDAKMPGDHVYLLGNTHKELGGSEYFALMGEHERGTPYIGNRVPWVNTGLNQKMYHALQGAIDEELIASAQSVHRGGLGIALAKSALGGMLGLDISLRNLLGTCGRDDYALYSESAGRVVVTVNPARHTAFESLFKGLPCTHIGEVRPDTQFIIRGQRETEVVQTTLEPMLKAYRATFASY